MKRITVVFLLTLAILLCWSAILPDQAGDLPSHRFSGSVPSDPLWPQRRPIDSIHVPTHPSGDYYLKKFIVKYGDNFHDILKSLKISSEKLNQINTQLNRIFDPAEFKVGIPYSIFYSADNNTPEKLVYEMDVLRPLQIDLSEGMVSFLEKEVDTQIDQVENDISSSLFESVVNAGAPEDLSDKILSIFAWKIDFSNLKKGDSYHVVYEKAFVDGEMIGSGNILAAEFIHNGQKYQGFAFDNGNGIEYFDSNGRNLSYAPLQFDLITSLYNRKRFHPVRRTYRSHLGMDFEAETGTPVEAPFDGTVLEARCGRANGNFVKIRHNEDLTTQYLHLSEIEPAITVGKTVKAGQKIGEVGSTGLSSGPHLCLRVWYKGKQRDPLDFDFPRRPDVSDENIPDFEKTKDQYLNQLTEPAL